MNTSIPISLFAYNFPHKKTQDFIFKLLVEGYNISVIYAANSIDLGIPKSTINSKIKHLGLIHPKKIAKKFGIKYIVGPHDSDQIIEDTISNPSIGLISGARVLKKKIIDCFPIGIINFHPGIIPHARGLDALFWSILNDQMLGVTSHLIDSKVDAGKILSTEKIDILLQDTILDISERLYETQIDMLPSTIEKTLNGEGYFLDSYGTYNKKMDSNLEKKVLDIFPTYVKKWSFIK